MNCNILDDIRALQADEDIIEAAENRLVGNILQFLNKYTGATVIFKDPNTGDLRKGIIYDMSDDTEFIFIKGPANTCFVIPRDNIIG